MGSCMGRCTFWSDKSTRFFDGRGIFSGRDADPDFGNLIDEKPVLELVEEILKSHHHQGESSSSYSRLNESSSSQYFPTSASINSQHDIPLQCLDARALLVHAATTAISTPASSLDLEWEHEGLPSTGSWAMLQEDESNETESRNGNGHASNHSDCSRVSSSVDSLEWDHVPSALQHESEVDVDTQLLLTEIERLTSEALKETGRSLLDGS